MVNSSCSSLIRTGIVRGYEPNGLSLDVSTLDTCQQCAEGKGCGMGLVARRQRQHIVLQPDCPIEDYPTCYPIGARVTFSVAKNDLTSMAFIVYALPLLFALILTGGAVLSGLAEWLNAVIFFVALISGVVVLKYRLRGRTERFRPRLVS